MIIKKSYLCCFALIIASCSNNKKLNDILTSDSNCSVKKELDNNSLFYCKDGTNAVIKESKNCVVSLNTKGENVIKCQDKETIIPNVKNGENCKIIDLNNGYASINCKNSPELILRNGYKAKNGVECSLVNNHDWTLTQTCHLNDKSEKKDIKKININKNYWFNAYKTNNILNISDNQQLHIHDLFLTSNNKIGILHSLNSQNKDINIAYDTNKTIDMNNISNLTALYHPDGYLHEIKPLNNFNYTIAGKISNNDFAYLFNVDQTKNDKILLNTSYGNFKMSDNKNVHKNISSLSMNIYNNNMIISSYLNLDTFFHPINAETSIYLPDYNKNYPNPTWLRFTKQSFIDGYVFDTQANYDLTKQINFLSKNLSFNDNFVTGFNLPKISSIVKYKIQPEMKNDKPILYKFINNKNELNELNNLSSFITFINNENEITKHISIFSNVTDFVLNDIIYSGNDSIYFSAYVKKAENNYIYLSSEKDINIENIVNAKFCHEISLEKGDTCKIKVSDISNTFLVGELNITNLQLKWEKHFYYNKLLTQNNRLYFNNIQLSPMLSLNNNSELRILVNGINFRNKEFIDNDDIGNLNCQLLALSTNGTFLFKKNIFTDDSFICTKMINLNDGYLLIGGSYLDNHNISYLSLSKFIPPEFINPFVKTFTQSLNSANFISYISSNY